MLRKKTTGETMEIVSSMRGRGLVRGAVRDTMTFIVETSHEAAAAFFAEGAELEDVQLVAAPEPVAVPEADAEEVTDIDAEAEPEQTEIVSDLSAYCMAGDIIDHRNGTLTVQMGAMTEAEATIAALEAENAALLFESLTGGEF